MSDYDLLFDQQQDAAKRAQFAENSTRSATHVGTFLSQGSGEFIQAVPTMFGVDFVGKPILTQGTELLVRPDPTVFQLPRATAGVFRWVTRVGSIDTGPRKLGVAGQRQILYVGAYLYFTVDAPYLVNVTSTALPVCQVQHNVRFDGIGMKQLPSSIMDNL